VADNEDFVLKSLVPNNLEGQCLPVLMTILNSFRNFLSKSPYLDDINLRKSLETQTNLELTNTMNNLENEIRDYMTSSAEVRSVKPTDIFSIIDEVNVPNEIDALFRFSKMGSSKDLNLLVEVPNLPNSKYLLIFFKFIPELLLLKNVYPIIEFINQVLAFYKMKIDRSKSKEYKIRDFLTTYERKQSFLKFQEAWEAFTN